MVDVQTDIQIQAINKATIQEVQCVPLKVNVDDRGYLIEIVRATDSYMKKFGQVYLVGDPTRGIIRAYHKHDILWDYFFVSHGSAKFILVDDRKESPTYGHLNIFIISERNPAVLIVPPGVYHGWMSLEDDTQMISTATEVYNREKPDEVRIAPDSFGDVWKVKGR